MASLNALLSLLFFLEVGVIIIVVAVVVVIVQCAEDAVRTE